MDVSLQSEDTSWRNWRHVSCLHFWPAGRHVFIRHYQLKNIQTTYWEHIIYLISPSRPYCYRHHFETHAPVCLCVSSNISIIFRIEMYCVTTLFPWGMYSYNSSSPASVFTSPRAGILPFGAIQTPGLLPSKTADHYVLKPTQRPTHNRVSNVMSINVWMIALKRVPNVCASAPYHPKILNIHDQFSVPYTG